MLRSLSALLLILAIAPVVSAQEGYYRFPAVHGSTVVFSSEGDLWKVPLSGGQAVRMTTHPGEERFPVLSPDGTRVAYYASYEGGGEVYVMPLTGGLPTRLTWDGGGSIPVAWTDDGRLVYRTNRYSGLPNTELAIVDPETFARERVPLSQAADAAYGPDGTLYFARLPKQGSNSRWYKGGIAEKIWKLAPGAEEAEPLTADYPGTSKEPLFVGARLYFLSDREGRGMNVWSMMPDGSDLTRHTAHDDFDVQEHSVSGTSLVYRLGADLWHLDLTSDRAERIPITLVSDFDQQRDTWHDAPLSSLESWNVSPDGKLVALVARGEVFVFPVDGGRSAHVSRDSGVRYRTAQFTPDGKHLLALSDESGEVEWWRLPVNGIGTPVQVSDGPPMLRQEGRISPDGKWLAHTDYDRYMWLVNLEDGSTKRISEASPLWSPGTFTIAWSPDSRYLTYDMSVHNRMASVHAYDLKTGTTTLVTSDRFEDFSAVFSTDGDWLYFLSNREFRSSTGSPWGARAPQPHFDRQTRIFALPLRDSSAFAFRKKTELDPAEKSDGKKPEDAKKAGATDAAKSADAAKAARPIDFGRTGEMRRLPVDRGNYRALTANAERLFYVSVGEGSADLYALDLKPDAKPKKLVEGLIGYELSHDGKKILVRKGSTFAVIDASAGEGVKLDDSKIDTSDWRIPVNPAREWRQIFVDAWRMHRDYFWDPAMHGVDWEAIRARMEPLVDRVRSREELTDIQAQMVSNLSLLHSNAGGGDVRRGDDSVMPASLGARFSRAEGGAFRVDHVFVTDPDRPEERSPLADPQVRVAAGALILAVNGVDTSDAPDMGALLRGQAGQPVRLRVRDADKTERDVIATAVPMGEEFDLRYDEWEYTRRLQTEELGGGDIGYVHLRAMGGGNIAEWTEGYFPVFNRKGLIIDVRHNNGGNIDAWILGQLLREAWSYFKSRTGESFWNQHYTFRGHLVVLVDERTASDGEAFADGFRRLGLGDAIGMRTWGGEVWLSGSNRQVDGGVVRASEGGVYGEEGEWLIEGWGFVPDVEVDNLPVETFRGRDAQLEAAVAHLQRLIEQDPRAMPEPPPFPTLIPGYGFPTPYRNQP